MLLGHILTDVAERSMTSDSSLIFVIKDDGNAAINIVVVRMVLVNECVEQLLLGALQREVLQATTHIH